MPRNIPYDPLAHPFTRTHVGTQPSLFLLYLDEIATNKDGALPNKVTKC